MARKIVATALLLMIFIYGAVHAKAAADDALAGRPCGQNFLALFKIRLRVPKAYRQEFRAGAEVSINRQATARLIAVNHSVSQFQYRLCTIKQIGGAHLFVERIKSHIVYGRKKQLILRSLLNNLSLYVNSPIAPLAFVVLQVNSPGRQNFTQNFIVPLIPFRSTAINIGYLSSGNDDLLGVDKTDILERGPLESQFLTDADFQDKLASLQNAYEPDKMACDTIPAFGLFAPAGQNHDVSIGLVQGKLEEVPHGRMNIYSFRRPRSRTFFDKLTGIRGVIDHQIIKLEKYIREYWKNKFTSPEKMHECFSEFWSTAQAAVKIAKTDGLYLNSSGFQDSIRDAEAYRDANALTKYWLDPLAHVFGLRVHWNHGPCSVQNDAKASRVKIEDGVSLANAKLACTVISNPLGLKIKVDYSAISGKIMQFHARSGMWYLGKRIVTHLPTNFLKKYSAYCGEAKALYYILSQDNFPFHWVGVYPFEPYVDYADCVNNVVNYERGTIPCWIVYKTELALANHLQTIRDRYVDYRKIYSERSVGLPDTLKEIKGEAIDNKRLNCRSTDRLAFGK